MEKSPKQRVSVVDETDIGVYIWQMPDGRWVGDDEGNFLSISAQKGDLRRVNEITSAVRSYGIEEGGPVFLPGRRKITDEELEEQEHRLSQGLVPDPYDIPALMEELRHGKFDR